jgi:hypothetical protein
VESEGGRAHAVVEHRAHHRSGLVDRTRHHTPRGDRRQYVSISRVARRDPGRVHQAELWRVRLGALIPPPILDTALRDIHGMPFLVGLMAGSLFEVRRHREQR